jgi:hypothetical protein
MTSEITGDDPAHERGPDQRSPEQRIADRFNSAFQAFEIAIEAADVVLGARRLIRHRGWHIRFRVDPDDGGFPSLEYYAVHRMTNDTHVRIWADGHAEPLEAIWEMYAWDPKVTGSEEAAHDRYLRHNREVAAELAERGLYPEGDINAFLRSGGLDDDPPPAPDDTG